MLFLCTPSQAENNNQDLNQLLIDSVSLSEEIDFERIEEYLKAGADPNAVSSYNKPVMSLFLGSQYHNKNQEDIERLIGLLINYGAKVSKSSHALFWSINSNRYFDSYKLTKLLLDNGASASTWDFRSIGTKLSPIEYALKDGHNEIAALLVEYGASMPSQEIYIQEQFINAISEYGWNFDPNFEKLSRFLENGAKINGQNKDGKTALVTAIGSFSFLKRPEFYLIRTIEFLLENGADPNKLSDYSFSSDRVTALHSLSWYSQFKNTSFSERFEPVYELLILNGAHISKKSEYEMTPLHYAAIENNADATEYLLSNNAKVSPKDKFGKTPLDYAESGDVIKLLKQNGATE